MKSKKIIVALFFSALVSVFLLLAIGNVGSSPENTEWSKAVFFVS